MRWSELAGAQRLAMERKDSAWSRKEATTACFENISHTVSQVISEAMVGPPDFLLDGPKTAFGLVGFVLGLLNIRTLSELLFHRFPVYGYQVAVNFEPNFLRIIFTSIVIWAASVYAHSTMRPITCSFKAIFPLLLLSSAFLLGMNLVLAGAIRGNLIAAPALLLVILTSMNFFKMIRTKLQPPVKSEAMTSFVACFLCGETIRMLFFDGIVQMSMAFFFYMYRQGQNIEDQNVNGNTVSKVVLYLVGLLGLYLYYSGLHKLTNRGPLRHGSYVLTALALLPLNFALLGCASRQTWWIWILHPLNVSATLFVYHCVQFIRNGKHKIVRMIEETEERHRMQYGVRLKHGTVDSAIQAAEICPLCNERKPNCVSMPCKHKALCDTCVLELKKSENFGNLKQCLVGMCPCETIYLPPRFELLMRWLRRHFGKDKED